MSLSDAQQPKAEARSLCQPTRHLYEGKRYTPSHENNIARTFRKARLLAVIQGKQS